MKKKKGGRRHTKSHKSHKPAMATATSTKYCPAHSLHASLLQNPNYSFPSSFIPCPASARLLRMRVFLLAAHSVLLTLSINITMPCHTTACHITPSPQPCHAMPCHAIIIKSNATSSLSRLSPFHLTNNSPFASKQASKPCPSDREENIRTYTVRFGYWRRARKNTQLVRWAVRGGVGK